MLGVLPLPARARSCGEICQDSASRWELIFLALIGSARDEQAFGEAGKLIKVDPSAFWEVGYGARFETLRNTSNPKAFAGTLRQSFWIQPPRDSAFPKSAVFLNDRFRNIHFYAFSRA